MKQCLAEISKEHPNANYDHVVVDFGEVTSLNEYQKLLEPVKKLDVDILCLNAGVADLGVFRRHEHQVC